MGTSADLSLLSPSSLPDWFNPDLLLTQALTRELSSTSGSSSSCSIPLDGFHMPPSFPQVGSPVISSNSISKDTPESPFNSCVSTMTNFSMPTESSASRHFQASHAASNQKLREENSPSCISSLLSAASTLSAAGSAGGAATRVSKRRPRVSKKAPIAVLSADASNFRAMVQQLTGIPTSSATPHMWGTSGAPLLRPQPTRLSFNGALPTLDTSACFLSPKQNFPLLQRAPQPLMNGLLSVGVNNNVAEPAPFQNRDNRVNYDALSSYTSLPGRLWDATGSGKTTGNNMKGNVKELSASSVIRECEQTFPRQSSTLFESLLMSDDDDDLHAKLSHNNVDSWLAFDGGVFSNYSPKVDLANLSS